MNKHTIIIAAVLVFVLLFSLTACGEKTVQETSAPTQQQTENATTVPEGVEPLSTDDVTLPQGEGVGSIEDLPINSDEDTKPTEEINHNDTTASSEDTKKNDTADPIEDTGTSDTTDPTEDTEPSNTTEPTENTEPDDNTNPTEGTDPEEGPCCEYFEYLAMTAAEQQEIMKKFPNTMAFIEWCRVAETAHKEHNDSTIVEGGELDVGDFTD